MNYSMKDDLVCEANKLRASELVAIGLAARWAGLNAAQLGGMATRRPEGQKAEVNHAEASWADPTEAGNDRDGYLLRGYSLKTKTMHTPMQNL